MARTNRVPIAPEGWIFILPAAILAAVALLVQWYFAAIVLGFLAAVLASFFRDPRRRGSTREVDVLSPADGTVIRIHEIPDGAVRKGLTRQISIFMSVFDVPVNRAPIGGKIVDYQYDSGGTSSQENAKNLIVIDDGRAEVAVSQIAGLLARRVIFDRKVGDRVARGERIGVIPFGSRVDIFLPPEAEIRVSMREKVKAGLTVMAHLEEKA